MNITKLIALQFVLTGLIALGIELRYGLVVQENRFDAALGTALIAAAVGIIISLIDSKKAPKE